MFTLINTVLLIVLIILVSRKKVILIEKQNYRDFRKDKK